MQKTTFLLSPESEYIELIGLLKASGVAQTGGHAKMIVDDGVVSVNQATESRKRYKVRPGDIININDEIEITVAHGNN